MHTSNTKELREFLYFHLSALQNTPQNPKYHPEGNALCHSLQVFALAHHASNDPALLAAALCHDIGKAINSPNHANEGADLLHSRLNSKIIWLIRHHIHLLRAPESTQKWLAGTPQLATLKTLWTWDLKGRKCQQPEFTLDQALGIILQVPEDIMVIDQDDIYFEARPYNQLLGKI